MKKEHKIYTYKGSDIDWSVSKSEPLILTLTNYIGNEDDVFVPSEVDSPNINANNYEYDYIACLYPEGNINEDYMYLFNHEDIDTVVYRGFSDAEEEAFVAELNKP